MSLKSFNVLMLVGFGIFLSTISCVRERDFDTTTGEEIALHEFVYHDAIAILDDAATKITGDNLSNYKTAGYCAKITHDTLSNPRSLIVDFDTINCLCNDGRRRKGKLVASYVGRYFEPSTVIDIKYDKYYVDNVLYMGSTSILNKGNNVAGKPYQEVVTAAKSLLPTSLDTFYWNAKLIRTWVEGYTTPIWSDDVYELTGTANGKNRIQANFATNITTPLRKEVACKYIIGGIIDLQEQSKALRTINYGTNTCDAEATLLINNKAFNINLK